MTVRPATMRRSMLELARSLSAWLYSGVLLRRWPAMANAVYDSLPHPWLRYLHGHGVFNPPDKVVGWHVTLSNSRRVAFAIDPADRFSIGMAFDYKVHDVGLRRTQEFFIDRGGPRTLYLDIGANIGVSSIYALSRGMHCWLFEPNVRLHEFGKRLFAENGFSTCQWFPTALSDSAEEAPFFISSSSFLSSFDPRHAAFEGDVQTINVTKRTLDSYLGDLREAADSLLIKIDVEGHELNVLRGATQLLSEYRPPLLMEVFPTTQARQETWDFFQALDYVCLGILEEHILRVQPISSLTRMISFSGINFVLLPAGHALLPELEACL